MRVGATSPPLITPSPTPRNPWQSPVTGIPGFVGFSAQGLGAIGAYGLGFGVVARLEKDPWVG